MNDNRSPRTRLPALLLGAALLLAGCETMAEGRPAPPVTGGTWMQAKGDPSADMKGRWTLLVMFRPSSPQCASGMPDVLALQKEFAPKGLLVLGVSPADAEDTAPFLKDNGVGFPVMANGRHVVDAYGIPEIGENHVYLLDPPGVVVVQDDLAKSREILAKYLK